MFSHPPLLTPTNEQMACKDDIEKHLQILNKYYISYTPIVIGATATISFAAASLLLAIKSTNETEASYNHVRPKLIELEAKWRNQTVEEYTREGKVTTTCGKYWGNVASMTGDCRVTVSPEREKELVEIYQGMKACFHLAYKICKILSDTDNFVAQRSFMIAFCILATAVSLGITITSAIKLQQGNRVIDRTSLANVLSTKEMQEFKDLISRAKLNLTEDSTLGAAVTTLKQIKRSIDNYNCDALTPMRPGLNN